MPAKQLGSLWELAISHLAGFAINAMLSFADKKPEIKSICSYVELLKALQVDEEVLQSKVFDLALIEKLDYFLSFYLDPFIKCQSQPLLVNLLKAAAIQFLAKADTEAGLPAQRRFRYHYIELIKKLSPELFKEIDTQALIRVFNEAEASQRIKEREAENKYADKLDHESVVKARTLFWNHVDHALRAAIQANESLAVLKALRWIHGAPFHQMPTADWNAVRLVCSSKVVSAEVLTWLIVEEHLPTEWIPENFWVESIANNNFPILTMLLSLKIPQYSLSILTNYLCKLTPNVDNGSKAVIYFDRFNAAFLQQPQLILQLIDFCKTLSSADQKSSSCYLIPQQALLNAKLSPQEEEICLAYYETLDAQAAHRYRLEAHKRKGEWMALKALCLKNISVRGASGHDVSRASLAEGLLQGKFDLEESGEIEKIFQDAKVTPEQKKAIQALYLLSALNIKQVENMMNLCFRLLSAREEANPSDTTILPNLYPCILLYTTTKQNPHNTGLQNIVKNAGPHLLTMNFVPARLPEPVYRGSLQKATELALEEYRRSTKS